MHLRLDLWDWDKSSLAKDDFLGRYLSAACRAGVGVERGTALQLDCTQLEHRWRLAGRPLCIVYNYGPAMPHVVTVQNGRVPPRTAQCTCLCAEPGGQRCGYTVRSAPSTQWAGLVRLVRSGPFGPVAAGAGCLD